MTHHNLKFIFAITVLAVGANYVLAQSPEPQWQAPSENPPLGNAFAPLNVGDMDQNKDGGLGVGALFVNPGKVRISDGTEDMNKVFASDENGVGSWKTLEELGWSGGGGSGGGTGDTGAGGASSFSCASESTEPEQIKTFSAPCIDSTGSCFVTLTANQRATTGATFTKEATFAFYTAPSGRWTSYPAFQYENPYFTSGNGLGETGVLVSVSGTGGCQLASAGNSQLSLTSLNTCSQFGCATAQCNVSVCRQ
ncbi:MAG: hypothetical protein Q8P93_01345 [bacterium]|nr:hypothetical protein [bacterium]